MATTIHTGFRLVNVKSVDADSNQPRKLFDRAQLDELAASIKKFGVLQPLLCRPAGDRFLIVCGERRYRAAQMASLAQIPVIVREMDDRAALLAQLAENVQRSDLGAIERAEAFRRLIEQGLTQEQIADQLGVSRPFIANSLRMLTVPASWQGQMQSSRDPVAESAVVQLMRLRVLDIAATQDVGAVFPFHPARSWSELYGLQGMCCERPACRTVEACKAWADRVLAWLHHAIRLMEAGAPQGGAWAWLCDRADCIGTDSADALAVCAIIDELKPTRRKLKADQVKALADAAARVDFEADPVAESELTLWIEAGWTPNKTGRLIAAA